MKVGRRAVLSGAIAAGAIAAAPAAAAAALGSPDRKRLAALLASGKRVEGEHFEFFDGKPVKLGGAGRFNLRNCRFTWHGKTPAGYLAFERQNQGEMTNCRFESASGLARPMIIRKI